MSATPLSAIKPATVDSESSQSPSLAGTGGQVASIQANQTGRTRTRDDSPPLLEDALKETTTSKRASPSDTRRVSASQPKPPARREILSMPLPSTSFSIIMEPFKKLVKSQPKPPLFVLNRRLTLKVLFYCFVLCFEYNALSRVTSYLIVD